MSKDRDEVIAAIIFTTVFWVFFMILKAVTSIDNDRNPYRQGFAECKAGMESRYDQRAQP